MEQKVNLSAIVTISENRHDDITELYHTYKNALEKTDLLFEIIYVVDGNYPEIVKQLKELKSKGEKFKILKLAKSFGEATAISIGVDHAAGKYVITLPAYEQVDANEFSKIIAELNTNDLVVTRRWPRQDPVINRVQNKVFHAILNRLIDIPIHDLGCGVRAFHKKIFEEINIYGDQHRFLPLLAHRVGFRIKEINVQQAKKDNKRRVHSLGIYTRRLLDLLSIFVLVKFTKKPIRFFGIVGVSTFLIGLFFTLYIVIERMFFGTGLADRPALIVSTLLVVLGIQILAIGLIGEIIIFTHAKELKEYTVDEIIN